MIETIINIRRVSMFYVYNVYATLLFTL